MEESKSVAFDGLKGLNLLMEIRKEWAPTSITAYDEGKLSESKEEGWEVEATADGIVGEWEEKLQNFFAPEPSLPFVKVQRNSWKSC